MTESPDEYGTYDTDDETQLSGEDTLGDGAGSDVVDELDRGYSPPERWSAAQGFGNTPYEESTGESFAQRLAQEEAEPDVADDLAPDEQYEAAIDRGEVGRYRAGRLVAADEGSDERHDDRVGRDIGIDGAAASAEEAAMHVIDDDDDPAFDAEDENTF